MLIPPAWTPRPPTPRAILVGIQLPDVDDAAHEASLQELTRLVTTLGYDVAGTLSQHRDGTGAATLLGAGKLAELAAITGGTGIIGTMAPPPEAQGPRTLRPNPPPPPPNPPRPSPNPAHPRPPAPSSSTTSSPPARSATSNARPAPRCWTAPASSSRSSTVTPIPARPASRSRWRASNTSPRACVNRRSAPAASRAPGAGESDLDLDRRKIRDRLAELREQLDAVQRDSDQRRSARRDQLRVALVGYTNAGKSSLMRALTGSQVLVEDKLFATLDTTVRALQPETRPRILVSDTVGFIKQLPHDLVASFRSTLAEALEASLLLFVVDASDPTYQAQLEVSRSVLQ